MIKTDYTNWKLSGLNYYTGKLLSYELSNSRITSNPAVFLIEFTRYKWFCRKQESYNRYFSFEIFDKHHIYHDTPIYNYEDDREANSLEKSFVESFVYILRWNVWNPEKKRQDFYTQRNQVEDIKKRMVSFE